MGYFTDELRSARKQKGLSQKELGDKIGVPQSHISKIESGTVDLQTSNLIQLSRALDLEPMLIPRKLMPLVKALVKSNGNIDESKPLYSLEDDECS